MTTIRLLHDLQEIDSELAKSRTQLASFEAKVGNEAPLAAPRAALETANHALSDVRAQQRDREMAVESIRTKIRDVERKMFSGKVANPKELDGMRKEVEMLKRQAGEIDDQTLALMDQSERAQADVKAAQAVVIEAEARWRQEQESGKSEIARLRIQMTSLDPRRRDAAARVPPAELVTYDRLRASKNGIAVARMTGGVCGACRMVPTSDAFNKARAGNSIAFCPNCGRILFAS